LHSPDGGLVMGAFFQATLSAARYMIPEKSLLPGAALAFSSAEDAVWYVGWNPADLLRNPLRLLLIVWPQPDHSLLWGSWFFSIHTSFSRMWALAAMLVPKGCCNQVPKIVWLKATDIRHLDVLVARSPKSRGL
jgi:hypothetical protein